MKGYSINEIPEHSSKGRLYEQDVSLKDAVNVAHFLRGMNLQVAKDTLDLVIEKKKPVPYFRYLDSVSHKKAVGPGRYPIKTARAFMKLLANAESNAEFNGLNTDNLKIVHVAASKGRMIKKYLPKAQGRSGASFKDLVNLEIVVQEEEE
ncbi:MAG: 50S ribosomal protein L22 [Thermoplasmatales archaeon]|nr:50S ribosomal protein L22 [Thermoplasmatales archaeon]MCW6170569.1 50S ribosomal protein L22 [Thermoplasmatales archaeon]